MRYLPPDRMVKVREYARLTTATVETTLDQATVSQTAFDWLCAMSARASRSGAKLLTVQDRNWLCLEEYVGVVQTPCGTQIEILPKHLDDTDDEGVERSRNLLFAMIEHAHDITPREAGTASLRSFEWPLPEWIMARFLEALERLVKRGLRHDYVRIEETQTFLRGQLDVSRQIRTAPTRRHLFEIRHDVFMPDRPENRLLKSALIHVSRHAREPTNWSLAYELLHVLGELRESPNIPSDFAAWRHDRLMAHYAPVRPWCELVLGDELPVAIAGGDRGMSLLFPMQKLFERYVERILREHLPSDARLVAQASRHSLCGHDAGFMFKLKPDFLVEWPGPCIVLDAKWKRIDATKREDHYDLRQADFYQLHAYGRKYLGGRGMMALLYPAWTRFRTPLPDFHFDDALSLRVLPVDLNERTIIGWSSLQSRIEAMNESDVSA